MTNNEECRYFFIDDDGIKREVTEDQVPMYRDIGTVIKIIGNGKVVIYTSSDERILEIGDYVLATKYDDGDPQDQWSIGFFNGVMKEYLPDVRYDVVDSEGLSFRGNGFRRVQVISCEKGKWLIDNMKAIECLGKSLWNFIENPAE